MAGGGFDKPPAIQSIENKLDELFDLDDDMKDAKSKRETVMLNVMGQMRTAGRIMYTYRDRTVKIEGKEKLKIQAPKKSRKRKEAMRAA